MPKMKLINLFMFLISIFLSAQTIGWDVFDAGNINGLNTKGYFGAAFDGRYVYYAPCRTNDFHGNVLRYDTKKDFDNSASWEAYNASKTDGNNCVGYSSAIYANGYVYFVPFASKSQRHAKILRFNTKYDFKDKRAWSSYDASEVLKLKNSGYVGAEFDGRYIFFAPFGYKPYAHGKILRYDTTKDFNNRNSYDVYDASETDELMTKGFYGTVYDQRYIYFVPFNDGKVFHARVLRYDTKQSFNSQKSWEAFDAGSLSGIQTGGYKGGVFDGRYVYFVPFRDSNGVHGKVLRYDTKEDFKSRNSWQIYDASKTSGENAIGYVGAVYVNKKVYFVPYSQENNVFHSVFLCYDTTKDFNNRLSWKAANVKSVNGIRTKGYKFATTDGRYIFFAPYNDGIDFSGKALRFDTEKGIFESSGNNDMSDETKNNSNNKKLDSKSQSFLNTLNRILKLDEKQIKSIENILIERSRELEKVKRSSIKGYEIKKKLNEIFNSYNKDIMNYLNSNQKKKFEKLIKLK